MIRVTDYFETQLHVPSMKRRRNDDPLFVETDYSPLVAKDFHGGDLIAQGLVGRAKEMSDEQMVGWFSKVLNSVRLRYRKLQRYVRHVPGSSSLTTRMH